jgi:DNA-binding response OmpR family regulator
MSNGPKVLLLGSRAGLTQVLRPLLHRHGFESLVVAGEAAALRARREWKPHAIIIECTPPHDESLRLCRLLARGGGTPVLPLIHGTSGSGEDLPERYAEECGEFFLCHPCSPGSQNRYCDACLENQLLPRVLVLIRRSWRGEAAMEAREAGRRDAERLVVGELIIDLRRHEVYRGERPLHLTPTEFRVLTYLAANAGRAVTRDELLSRVWGFEYAGGSNLVDVTIHGLRHKVERDPRQPELIATVWGVGYRLEDPASPEVLPG